MADALHHLEEGKAYRCFCSPEELAEHRDRMAGTGKPGPITRRAQELFGDAVAGRLSRYADWLDYV